MTAYTDDDVTAAAAALVALVKQHPLTGQAPWDAAIGVYGAPTERDLVAAVLDAVAPAIAARARMDAIDWIALHGQSAVKGWVLADATEWALERAERTEL